MLRLRQKTRRQLCRAGFLCICLLPAAGLVIWGTYRHSPQHQHEQELDLRQVIGLAAKVGDVAYPRPGVVRYRDLELAEPETGTLIATCALVEVRAATPNRPQEFIIHEVSLEPAAIPACYELLTRLLRRDESRGDFHAQVIIEKISFASADKRGTLARIGGTIRTGATDCEARLTVTPAEADAAAGADKILLRVAHHREAGKPDQEWELHTGDQSIDCVLLPAPLDNWPGLDDSQFRGSIGAQHASDQWQLALRGKIAGVDLGAMLASHFPHVLQARADVELTPAIFAGQRIVDLQAHVTCGPGRIGHSLLTSANLLGCTPAYEAQSAPRDWPFANLGFDLEINAQGQLHIAGCCPGDAGVLVTDLRGRPLLSEPRKQPQPALSLVKALAGAEGPPIPATPQASVVLGWLPHAAIANSARPAPAAAAARPATDQQR